jgi:pyruvate ferredoxin oxidoreductase delta subunit
MAEDEEKLEYLTSMSKPVKGCAGDTGEWRIFRPVKDAGKCNECLICWVFCPEACITRDGVEIDYQYCKGCGICAVECPTDAIIMVKEEKL